MGKETTCCEAAILSGLVSLAHKQPLEYLFGSDSGGR